MTICMGFSTSFFIFILVLILILDDFVHAVAPARFLPFDVRNHLSTTSRYSSGVEVESGISSHDVVPPTGCVPIHLNLVARHGTRSPTKNRIKDMDRLALRLESLVDSSLEDVPEWLKGWRSPWRGKKGGGELVRQGQEELFQLGIRARAKFPDIFKDDYHHSIYTIRATQVARASASAVAFGMGLFLGKGFLGHDMHHAFAVMTESRSNDIHLRFYETCQKYKDRKALQKSALRKQLQFVFSKISSSLVDRFKLNFTAADIPALWFLCKQQAAALDITDQACTLFTPEEVKLLEWTDDMEIHLLKGYGESINYRMGIPLLKDVVESMEEAILASEGVEVTNPWEKARLRFAHAETVIPFTCLLGLFLDKNDVENMQREQAMEPLPMPPMERFWRGSLVAPYGANTMVALYKCPPKRKDGGKDISEFLVQVFHNERPTTLSDCNNSHFCSFKDFQDFVVAPHLRESFDSLCSATSHSSSKCSNWFCRFIMFFRKFLHSFRSESCQDRSEL